MKSLTFLICIWVFEFQRACASLIASPSPEKLLQSDQIIYVDATNVSISGMGPDGLQMKAKDVLVLKGIQGTEIAFTSTMAPTANCSHYLIFLSKKDGKYYTATWGSIIGMNLKKDDLANGVESPNGFYALLSKAFISDEPLEASLLQAYLLSQVPGAFFKGDTPPLGAQQVVEYMKRDNNPLREIAALVILLQVRGAPALDMVNVPDIEKMFTEHDGVAPFGVSTYYARALEDSIRGLIRHNASPENYEAFSKFAKSQSVQLRASILIDINQFAKVANLGDVKDMFVHDDNLDVKYACIQNFCTAYNADIPSIDVFHDHKEEMIAYWTRKLGISK